MVLGGRCYRNQGTNYGPSPPQGTTPRAWGIQAASDWGWDGLWVRRKVSGGLLPVCEDGPLVI